MGIFWEKGPELREFGICEFVISDGYLAMAVFVSWYLHRRYYLSETSKLCRGKMGMSSSCCDCVEVPRLPGKPGFSAQGFSGTTGSCPAMPMHRD